MAIKPIQNTPYFTVSGKKRGRYTATEISNVADGSLIAWDGFYYDHYGQIVTCANVIVFNQVKVAVEWVQDGMPKEDLQGEVFFAPPKTDEAHATWVAILKERGVLS